ncbi:hypothetical protein LguiA_015631 [Lonicera macranthoides]
MRGISLFVFPQEEESPAAQPQAQSIGFSEEVPLQIPSSLQHTKPIVDQILSRLRPPRKQNPNDQLSLHLVELSKEIVPQVKSFLVSQLTSKNTTLLNTMIDLANNVFSTLDWCCTDYSSFHCNVHNFICCYSSQLVNRVNDAEEALMNAEGELTTAVEKLEPLKSEIVKVRKLLRQLEKEMADREVEIEALKGKRDGCADEFSNAENEALKMSWQRWEIDQRIESAMEADERMRDQLRISSSESSVDVHLMKVREVLRVPQSRWSSPMPLSTTLAKWLGDGAPELVKKALEPEFCNLTHIISS